MTTQHPEYLGQEVLERRRALGLSKHAIYEAVGLTPFTVGKIEKGEAGQIRNDTLARLDKALRWQDGSAAAALRHRRPPTDLAAAPAHIPSVLYVPFPPELIQATVSLAETVADVARDDDRLASVVTDMHTIADRVLRAWTIADIERQRYEGTLSEAMIEMLLGHYMRRTPQAPTAADQDELMYLRWLLGRLPEEESGRAERFTHRWARVEQMLAAPRQIKE